MPRQPKGIIGYMDKIDFDCELGYAQGGNVVYPSLKDVKRHLHAQECGIVRVRVTLEEIIEESDYGYGQTPD